MLFSQKTRLNWRGQFLQEDGYGRFNTKLVKALGDEGAVVQELERAGDLTVTCLPPFMLQYSTNRHWLYTMTEGSLIPPLWKEKIEWSGVERVIVPCQHNALAFRNSGITVPISVVPGGVDSEEFHPVQAHEKTVRPFTFLTFADRGSRKGWEEVWGAFYKAFGGKRSGKQDVRLIIKSRLGSPSPVEFMCNAGDPDPRITYHREDLDDMRSLYLKADCLVLPSRSEGWGMIQREVASMGIPVITQKYSGLDDGNTEKWAYVLPPGKMQVIPKEVAFCLGEWMIADQDALAEKMQWVLENREEAALFGLEASAWLRGNCSWRQSALGLMDLVQAYG